MPTIEKVESLLPESMRELWFLLKEEPDWGEIDLAFPDIRFDLTSDGENYLTAYYYFEEGESVEYDEEGIIDEWYAYCGCVEYTLDTDDSVRQLINNIAYAVADSIVANGDEYEPEAIHPLIRAKVAYLLENEFTRPYWS